MDHSTDDSAAKTGRTLEIEMRLVRDAIAMVAGGGAPRVVLAGLRFGEALLASGRLQAAAVGVRIVPLWMPDDAGADLAIERITDD